jgi:hypothetical protein
MMSLPYRSLALRSHPLSPSFVMPRVPNPNGYSFTMHDPQAILAEDIRAELAAAALVPRSVALFYKAPGTAGRVHTDLVWNGTRWLKWTCAVNWDLFGAESAMSWYECRARECWPTDDEGRKKTAAFILDGVHFNRRMGTEIDPDDLFELAAVRLTGPTLVRTNVAHSVAVSNDSKPRWCLSIRFTQDFRSWDEAVRAFEPLFERPASAPKAKPARSGRPAKTRSAQ